MLKKISLIVLLSVVAIMGLGLAIVCIYEDEIKDYALEEISKQLKSDFQVGDVNLTLWDQFPSASLQFENLYLEGTLEAKDTLIFAKSVYLNFSLSDFFSGNYEVQKVAIEGSQVNLKRLESGDDNFHFWKESEGESSNFTIDLNTVSLSDSRISYSDKKSNTDLLVHAKTGEISGSLGSEKLELSGDIDTHVHFLRVQDKEYIDNKGLAGNSSISIDLKNEIYSFGESDLAINGLPFSVSGTIDIEENKSILDLSANTEDANLSELVKNLPSFVQESMSSFDSEGNFKSEVSVKGEISEGLSPDIVSKFSLKNGAIKNKASKISLTGINSSGSYVVRSGKEDLLTFDNLKCQLGSGSFSGKGKISRLTNPYINAEASGNIELETFRDFFNLDEIESLKGKSEISISYKGNLGNGWKPSSRSIRNADISGRVAITDATLKLARNPHEFQDISGEFLLTKGDAAINHLSSKIDNSDFKFDGFFRNLMPYLLVEEEVLVMESSLKSEHIDFNTLLSSSASADSDYAVNLPERINFNLSAEIGSLEFREFKANDVDARLKLNSKDLKISPLAMKTAGGSFQANITATQRNDKTFDIVSDGNIQQVDVSSLFKGFEDFQQNFITHKHLKGTATTDFTFSAEMNNMLEISSKSVDVLANIKLENGELIGHESLSEMGAYLEEKKILSAMANMGKFNSKLDHVKFSELKNQILIKNERISIPKMEIKSDALDILAEGTHSFNNEIDYSIGFDIADITTKEHLTEDEKGLSKMIFISMTGSTSDPAFSYNRLAVKEQRKENRKEEAQKIKTLIKEEFSSHQEKESSGGITESKSPLQVIWNDKPSEDKKKKKKEKSSISIKSSTTDEEEEDDDF